MTSDYGHKIVLITEGVGSVLRKFVILSQEKYTHLVRK